MAKETYKEMRDRFQKEHDALPIGFAFGEKQLSDLLEKWDCTREEICSYYGAGDIIRKSDWHLVKEMNVRHYEEMQTALSDFDFARSAMISEMWDHECYLGDFEDALRPLGLNWDDLKKSEHLRNAFTSAHDYYCERFEELNL